MSRNNLAYDLSKYENTVQKPEAEVRKIKVRKASTETAGSPVRIFVLLAAAGILMSAVIYGKVEHASLHAQIAEQTAYVDVLRSENVRMQTAIESKSALRVVEEYAANVLGMQKLDKSQIEYISLENGNVIDIPEQNDNIFVKLKHGFEDFVEYIRG